MKIAVIGAGKVGGTLGRKWAEAGHEVVYGVRTPEAPATAPVADAVAGAEVVVLAIPGAAAKTVLASLGRALAGKVVIDTTNDMRGEGNLHAIEEIADGAHPVRAFSTLGWENFADPMFDGVKADLFYAAEEGRAQEVADELIADIGLEPVWLGGLDTLDVVDSLARLWFLLALKRNHGRRLAFKMLVDQ